MKRTILSLTLVVAMVVAGTGGVLAKSTTTPDSSTKQHPTTTAPESFKQETTAATTPEGNVGDKTAAGAGPSAFPGTNGPIAYDVVDAGSGLEQIYTIPSTGGTPTKITSDNTDHLNPEYSPDGTKIVYSGSDANEWEQIWTIPSTGGTPTKLTSDNTDHRSPSYSPDGTKIAYYAYDGTNNQIYTIPSAGGTPTKITSDSAYHLNPDWGPKIQYKVYGAYPYPGSYYSACSCYVTPAKSQSVYAYGLEVPSKAGSNTRLDFYYYDQNQGKFVFQSTQQAPNYDEGGYSLFLAQVQLANSGFWQMVALDPDSGSQDQQYWYVY